MRSFQRRPNNRRAIYLQLIGSIESQLRQAFAKRHEKTGLTQAELARKLGVGRSVINRRLSGRSNLTAESIADMAWGLGVCVKVDIFDPADVATNDFMIVPVDHSPKVSTTTSTMMVRPSFQMTAPELAP